METREECGQDNIQLSKINPYTTHQHTYTHQIVASGEHQSILRSCSCGKADVAATNEHGDIYWDPILETNPTEAEA